LITAKISIQEKNKYLQEIKDEDLPALDKCLKYLFKNNCLSKDNFEKLVVESQRNNLSIKRKSLIIEALSNKNILNQQNFDLIFNHPIIIVEEKWSRQYIWRTLIETLLNNKNLITQDNLNKIFLHKDFKGLIKVLNIFSPNGENGYGVITQDFLNKITSQENLVRFSALLSYVPDSIWQQSSQDITLVVDKLIQCNQKLGNQKIAGIKEIRQHSKQKGLQIADLPGLYFYKDMNKDDFNNMLDKCNTAPTSKASADSFSPNKIIPIVSIPQHNNLEINSMSEITNTSGYPLGQINDNIDNRSGVPSLPPSTLGTLLLLAYGLFKIKGKNLLFSNSIPSVNSAKEKNMTIVEKQLAKGIERYS
jgi:hypothetical protein